MREDVESLPETQTEFGKNRMKTVEVNDPVAMCCWSSYEENNDRIVERTVKHHIVAAILGMINQ